MDTQSNESKVIDGDVTPKLTFADLLLMTMLVVIPPLHATGFTRADDLRTPVFVLGALLLFIVSSKARKPVKLVFGFSFIFLGYLFLQSLLTTGFSNFWNIYAVAPLAAGAVVIAARSERSRSLPYAYFASAVGVGAIISSIFTFLDLFNIKWANTVWQGPGTFGAFDAQEFALAYYGIAAIICLGGAVTVRGPLRYLNAVAAAISAYLFGYYPTLSLLVIFSLIAIQPALPVLLRWLKNRGKGDPSTDTPRLSPTLSIIAPIILIACVFVGHTLHLNSTTKEEGTIVLGNENWANSLPSLTPRNNPLIDGERLNTEFASGRWETITNSEELSKINNIASYMIGDKPLFGYGPNSWWNEQTDIYSTDPALAGNYFSSYTAYKTVHNGFMQIAAELGSVGLVLFFIMILAPIILTIFSDRKEERHLDQVQFYQKCSIINALLAAGWCASVSPAFQLAAPMLLIAASLSMLTNKLPVDPTLSTDDSRVSGMLPFRLAIICYTLFISVVALGCVRANFARGLGDQAMLYQLFDKANTHYNDAESYTSGNADFPYNIALCKLREPGKRDYEEIEKLLQEAIAIRPYDARFYAKLAEVQMRLGKFKIAKESASNAIKYYPNYISAYEIKGEIAQGYGEYNERIAVNLELLARKPPRSVAYQMTEVVAGIYLDILKDYANATQYLTKALELAYESSQREQIRRDLKRAELLEKKTHLEREGKQTPEALEQQLEELEHSHHGHHH